MYFIIKSFARNDAMIENLLMKREYFPLEIIDSDGKISINEMIIPPLHRAIVKEDIDLRQAYSAIDPAMSDTVLDLKDFKSWDLRPELLRLKDIDPKIRKGLMDIRLDRVHFPKFPWTDGLCIQKHRISPHGNNDSYVKISTEHISAQYAISKNIILPKEFLEEYDLTLEDLFEDFQTINTKNTGWRSHNVDFRDVYYKNFIIALNNAVVKKLYQLY